MAINEAWDITMSKFANKVTVTLQRTFRFSDLMKTALSFDIVSEKRYDEELVASCIADIVKDMMRYAFLTGIRTGFHCRYIPKSKIML